MGNWNDRLLLNVVLTDESRFQESCIQLLRDSDLDLCENEEYFREDTLALGFKDEAERLVKEHITQNVLEDEELSKQFEKLIYAWVSRDTYYNGYEARCFQEDGMWVLAVALTF